MTFLALLIVAALFVGLLGLRLSGANRAFLFANWHVLALAAAAAFSLSRGRVWLALILVGVAAAIWWMRRRTLAKPAAAPQSREDAAARALLGVGPNADEQEIRAAYRAKMARAHPDQGGDAAQAARLTAARDRLLRR